MENETDKIFTKSDYLTPRRVAQELNTDEETAYKIMRALYLKRATIMVKNKSSSVARPIVICAKYSRSNKAGVQSYRMRSDGLGHANQYLQELKNKGR